MEQNEPLHGARIGIGRFDRWAAVGFLVLPLIVFLVPLAFGHPLMAGDDLNQNFPLRKLAAQDIAHFHGPLWDPYIWSGTPLLGGFNAGAAFPSTLLFVILPAKFAWSLGEAMVFMVAGLGMYAFLRALKLAPISALFGSATWCLAGFMGSQLVHLELVQAWGLVPVALLAILRLGECPKGSRPMWSAVLGICLALIVLTGSPEGLIEGTGLIGVYFVYRLWVTRSFALVVWTVIAGAVGVLIGSIQWLPGLAVISTSQRSATNYHFFVSGSIEPSEIPNLFIPYLLGGFGRFGIPSYIGEYSLTEISGYPGILAMVAIVSLPLKGVLRQGQRASKGWGIWYVIGALGIILALGENTPIDHLLYRVPAYGSLRLPSRNLAWLDLAASVILAYWVQSLIGWKGREARGDSRTTALRWVRMLPYLPSAVIALISISVLAGGGWVISSLAHVPVAVADTRVTALRAVALVALVFSTGVAVLIYLLPRLRRPQIIIWLSAVLVLDLGFYAANQWWVQSPSNKVIDASTAQMHTISTYLGGRGHVSPRYAIYDPYRHHIDELNELAQPDLNVLARLPSVQGYGSLISSSYEKSTGTHQQLTVNPASLANGTMDLFGLKLLLTTQDAFSTQISGPRLAPETGSTASSASRGYSAPSDLVYPPLSPPSYVPGVTIAQGTFRPGETRSWLTGDDQYISSIRVTYSKAHGESASGLEPGVVRVGGQTAWSLPQRAQSGVGENAQPGVEQKSLSAQGAQSTQTDIASGSSNGVNSSLGSETFYFQDAQDASGIALKYTGTGQLSVRNIEYMTVSGALFELKGSLQGSVLPGHWQYAGHLGDYIAFENLDVRPAVWVVPLNTPLTEAGLLASRPVPYSSAKMSLEVDWAEDAVKVYSPVPARLVFSMNYDPGWSASISVYNPATQYPDIVSDGPVIRAGFLQTAQVPAGKSTVRFSMGPSYYVKARELTAFGVVLVLALLFASLLLSRRRLERLTRQR